MKTCPSHKELQLFLDGLMKPEASRDLDDHIESCPACQQSLDVLTRGSDPKLHSTDQPHSASSSVFSPHLRGDIVKRLLDSTDIKQHAPRPRNDNVKPETNALPTEIGDHEILYEIGRGGMGIVYAARQNSLGRIVALKVLPQQRFRSETSVARFRREARAASRLHHTNIVPIFEVGEDQGIQYFTMQLINGPSLSRIDAKSLHKGNKSTDHKALQTVGGAEGIQSAIFPVKQDGELATTQDRTIFADQDRYRFVAEMGRQIASALTHAHERGVIHRDVKPSNILLGEGDIAWLADFGLAKQAEDDLTGSLEVPGTFRFMAPERFRGVSDERSDIYSLGATMYELLAGRPAFDKADRVVLMNEISRTEATALRVFDPTIPRDLQTIVSKSMAKEPERRYSRAADMAEDLRLYLSGEPVRARRVGAIERLCLWAKKERALATSLGVVLLMMVGTVVGALFAAQQQTRLAEEKAAETEKAKEQRDLAIHNAYFADMKTAFDDWQNGHTKRMLNNLKQYLPENAELGTQNDFRDWEWYYLLSLAHRDECTIHHDRQVLQVCWSPDGSQIFSGSTDETLGIWNEDGQPIKRIKVPGLLQFTVSPTGDRIATVSGDSVVRVWDTQTFALVNEVKVDLPSIELVDWSPLGNRLAVSAGLNCKPIILDTASWQVEMELGPIRRGEILNFSPDGRFVVYGYLPIKVWDFNEKREAASIHGWNLRGMTAGWSSDSRRFGIGGVGNGCHLFELKENRRADANFKRLRVFLEDRIGTSIRFHPDGKRVLVGDKSNRVSVLNQETWGVEQTFQGHLDFVSSVDWHPKDNRAVSASLDGTIKIWNTEPLPKAVEAIGGGTKLAANEQRISPDGKWSWEVVGNTTIFRNAQTDEVMATIPEPFDYKPYSTAYFFPTSNRVLLDNNWTTISSWSTETWQQEKAWEYTQLTKGVQIADDKICVVEGEFGRPPWVTTLIDIPTLQSRTILPHHQVLRDNNQPYRDTDLAIRLNSKASQLVTASSGEVKIWDTRTLRERHTLVGHEPAAEMYPQVWSSTGKYVASLSADQTAIIWDVETGNLVTNIKGHQSTVYYLQFSKDDSRVLTVGNVAKLWDVATGREILTTNTTESRSGKYSFEHVLSDFDTPLIRDFFVHKSKTDFKLPDSLLRFEPLEKTIRLRQQAASIEQFQHAGLHDLALSLVARPRYNRYDCVRGLSLAEQAVALAPNRSEYRWTLALAEIRNKDYKAAIATARRARELAPRRTIRCDLIIAYSELMLGNDLKARDLYRNVAASIDDGQVLERVERSVLREIAPNFLIRDLRSPNDGGPILVNTLHDEVGGKGNGKTSLREAVWMAAPGDRIEFAVSGKIQLRHGPIEVRHQLSIAGPGADELMIHASRDARIFTVRDDVEEQLFQFELSGLRLVGGRETWPTYSTAPNGKRPDPNLAPDAMVRGIVIDPNLDLRGGAIYSAEDIRVESVVFESNAAVDGGAIYAARGGVTLRKCAFRNNGADNFETKQGGACYFEETNATDLKITDCEFSHNVADTGGAVSLEGKAVFENCSFISNRARENSAVNFEGTAMVNFDHCSFTENVGDRLFDDSAFCFPSKIRVAASEFKNNRDATGKIHLRYDVQELTYDIPPESLETMSTLGYDQYLKTGEALVSENGNFQARIVNDGNFVVEDLRINKILFQMRPDPNPSGPRSTPGYGVLSHSGSFLLMFRGTKYDASTIVWSTKSLRHGPFEPYDRNPIGSEASWYFKLQDDGRLVHMDTNDQPVFGAHRLGAKLCVGDSLHTGSLMVSENGEYTARILANGQFIIQQSVDGRITYETDRDLFPTMLNRPPDVLGHMLQHQPNNALILYRGPEANPSRIVWSTKDAVSVNSDIESTDEGTATGASYFQVTNDGRFVLVDAGNSIREIDPDELMH